MGYCIFSETDPKKAKLFRDNLQNHNHFNNVLFIYKKEGVVVELWKGKHVLQGKLTKDQKSKQSDLVKTIHVLQRFFEIAESPISNPKTLAVELAVRAKYLFSIAQVALKKEIKNWSGLTKSEREKHITTDNWKTTHSILRMYKKFNTELVKMTQKEFADVYAQTLSYGLLSACWMSKSMDRQLFTLKNVTDLLPNTSLFLKNTFTDLLQVESSPELQFLIEDLISLLRGTDIIKVFENEKQDPVIHFYEPFLDQYDKKLRASRGVYYTPDEVVEYIVHTTHNLLKNEFNLPLGLADETTWGELEKQNIVICPKHISPDTPFVQILDPATGTGTFLKSTICLIRQQMKEHWLKTHPKSLLPKLWNL